MTQAFRVCQLSLQNKQRVRLAIVPEPKYTHIHLMTGSIYVKLEHIFGHVSTTYRSSSLRGILKMSVITGLGTCQV